MNKSTRSRKPNANISTTATTRSAPPTYGATNRIENEQLASVERVQVQQQQQQQQPAESTTSASTSGSTDRRLTPPQQPTTSTGNIASNPAGQDMFALMNQFLQVMQNQPKEKKKEDNTLNDKLFGKLRRFTGDKSEDFDEWLEDFEAKIGTQKCSDNDRILILRSNLDGGARTTFSGFGQHEKSSYANVIKTLREIYTKKHSIEYVHELRNLKKQADESCEAFAGRIRKNTIRAYPNSPVEEREKTVIDYFINGLDGELKEVVATHKPLTVNEAIELAYRHEKLINITAKNEKKRKSCNMMVVKEEQDETDEDIKPAKIPKRNGGEQKINLCSIVQQMNNNNKQLMSSTKQFHQKLDSRLDELEKKVNNQKEYKNDNSNDRSFPANRTNPSSMNYNNNFRSNRNQNPGKFIGFSTNRSPYESISDKLCFKCGANNHLKANCPFNNESNSNNLGNFNNFQSKQPRNFPNKSYKHNHYNNSNNSNGSNNSARRHLN